MKERFGHARVMLLVLCLVLCAFYTRAVNTDKTMDIPVERVFAQAAATTASPSGAAVYRTQRDTQRSEEYAALSALAQQDEKAAQRLEMLIHRSEQELAVESALAAMGESKAVCAVREGAVTICVSSRLDERQAQAIIELCARLTGVDVEKVFILDECGYL